MVVGKSNDKLNRRNRCKKSVRGKMFGKSKRPRLSVHRSSKYIYAQIIDDEKGETLAAVSEKDLVSNKKTLKLEKCSRIDKARLVGGLLAKKAKSKKVTRVVFDRGSYKYHGKVKALAEGAREGGLKF